VRFDGASCHIGFVFQFHKRQTDSITGAAETGGKASIGIRIYAGTAVAAGEADGHPGPGTLETPARLGVHQFETPYHLGGTRRGDHVKVQTFQSQGDGSKAEPSGERLKDVAGHTLQYFSEVASETAAQLGEKRPDPETGSCFRQYADGRSGRSQSRGSKIRACAGAAHPDH